MDRWQLNVWTRFAAALDEVWRLETDPSLLAEGLRPFRIALSDAGALQSAIREGRAASFETRFTGPLGVLGVSWPMEIHPSSPPGTAGTGAEFRDTSSNLLFSEWSHRHRFEPTVDGKVRYLDEVRFRPALGPESVVVEVMRRVFVHRHRVAAKKLPVDPHVVGVSILRRYNPDLEPDHPDLGKE